MSIELMRAKNPDSDWIDLGPLFKVSRRFRWLLVVLMLVGGSAGIVASKYIQPKYLANSRLLITSQKSLLSGGLSSLSMLIGGGLDGASGGDQNYPEVSMSDSVIEMVVHFNYRTMHDSATTLEHFLGVDTMRPSPRTPYLTLEQQKSRAIAAYLRDALKVTVEKGIVSIDVKTKDPFLAAELNQHVVEAISWFNERNRKTSAKRQELFLEARQEESENRLNQSEQRLTAFMQQNKNILSPDLAMTQKRLYREIEMNNQMNIEFRRQYELARLEAERDAFTFSVLRYPEVPDKAYWPRKSILGGGGIFAGILLFLGFIVCMLLIDWRRARHKPA